ncbi:hypothetical protein HK103_002073 [Boothiomyces macroporosus]|uniref:Uncharacterized protein n=1 Tax=Boothiomyces macroporosus TaxID=261099 RepID=A0AAD5U9V4_9FUNG|nr:hypothetical protein HK103_002073 [Boothiomyces macroporosus]
MSRTLLKLPPTNHLQAAFKQAQSLLGTRKSEIADINNHKEYYANPDFTKEIHKKLHFNLFKRHVLPKTMEFAEKDGIFDDALPQTGISFLEVQFENTKWNGCYGHPIQPRFTMEAPTIAINKSGLFTVMMTDLDHEFPERQSRDECTNVKVQDRLVIDGGYSNFLGEKKDQTVGSVVYDYVPPHPPLSNPRKEHRYLITLWKQSKELSLEKHSDLAYAQRGTFLPSMRFAKDNGLELDSFAWFKSSWDRDSSAIMQKLDYLKRKIQVSTELAKTNPDDIQLLNHGYKPHKPLPKLPTKADLNNQYEKYQVKRKQRLTALGNAALVRNREGVETEIVRKNRYENA